MFDDRYLEYVELFNERCFYDCHEVLEDLWLDQEGPPRRFYQGLIHLAAAYLHLLRRNMSGCEQRFSTTLAYLADFPDVHEGLDLAAIRRSIHFWQARLAARKPGEIIPYEDHLVPVLSLEGE